MNTAERLRPSVWPRIGRISRLCLGGVLIGAFAGIYLGALLGIGYGLLVADLSSALDGALLGSGLLAAAGAIYGFVLGLTERNPDAAESSDEVEHTHVR